ncbi:MAG: ribosome assembly cofactor RimP [Prevotella sp.]|nr:ribosome assembly cofactor RimP [Prevotella sp.]MDY4039890.1 ribosome assembly cofactor RimP [Prevotella sp.]
MIDKNVVKNIVEDWLKDKEYFLVDIEISQEDKIVVEIDHADGVWIEDCADLSKHIEDRLDREDEDYELEVGSAGLGQPFKVFQQYVNNIGHEVEVMDADGKKFKGILKQVDGDDFTVTVTERVREEGKKRPVKKDVDHLFHIDQVKYTKYIISFK